MEYHYIMVDFCYYANYLLYTFLFLFPTNRFLYHVCFAFGAGPLGVATIIVRNSMVLHDIDYITSAFIHIVPNLVMYNVHWVTQYHEDRGWDLYDAKQEQFSLSFTLYYYGVAFAMYIPWAYFFYSVLFVWGAKRIKENNYLTLITHVMKTNKFAEKVWTQYGEDNIKYMYMITHVILQFCTTTIGYICYWSHSFYVFIMVT